MTEGKILRCARNDKVSFLINLGLKSYILLLKIHHSKLNLQVIRLFNILAYNLN